MMMNYCDFDDQNNVEIQSIDEEDFPLASITKHEASDEEFCSGTWEIILIVTSQFWHVT